MKHTVSLESHMDNARKCKQLKAQKDRLLDALRSLVEATATARTLTDEQRTALDKAMVAIQCQHEANH
jgi:ABC-type transporter Mla subunit MlaD